MDNYKNDISMTDAFKNALFEFSAKYPTHNWTPLILANTNPMYEVYAQIYGSVNGNVDLLPVELQTFYR
jgi:hypothetical protein